MNTSQLAALRWMMERELSALRSPRMSPEISLKCPDENELASRLSERAVDERLTARRVERIRDLENALRRIEVMDYGVCEACGEPIPLLRLLASPSVRWSSPDHLTLRVPGVQCRRVPSHRLCPFSCPGADRQAIDSSRINGFF